MVENSSRQENSNPIESDELDDITIIGILYSFDPGTIIVVRKNYTFHEITARLSRLSRNPLTLFEDGIVMQRGENFLALIILYENQKTYLSIISQETYIREYLF